MCHEIPLSGHDGATVRDRSRYCAVKRRTWEVAEYGGVDVAARIDLIEDRPRDRTPS
jgi:hypothetical protein